MSRRLPNLTESVAVVPSQGVSAPADLAARFSSVLDDAQGRTLSADALFDTLQLELLDWAFDNDIETTVVDTEDQPVTAGDGKQEA